MTASRLTDAQRDELQAVFSSSDYQRLARWHAKRWAKGSVRVEDCLQEIAMSFLATCRSYMVQPDLKNFGFRISRRLRQLHQAQRGSTSIHKYKEHTLCFPGTKTSQDDEFTNNYFDTLPQPWTESSSLTEQQSQELWEKVDKSLKGKQRAVIRGVFAEGCTLTEVARDLGIPYKNVCDSRREGIKALQRALVANPTKGLAQRVVTVRGVAGKVPDLAKHFGIPYTTVLSRVRRGADIADALTRPLNKKSA